MTDREKTLLYGTLDTLILKAVSLRPMHGYGIAQWLLGTSSERIRVDESSLYPALYRLEAKGLLKSEWGRSELDRRAKFYSLTEKGRTRLREQFTRWADFAEAVADVLGAKAPPPEAEEAT